MTSRSLYARTAAAVLRHPWLGLAMVWGSVMHAFGHALLAAAGGGLARALGGGGLPGNGRSIHALSAIGRGDPLLGLAIGGLFAATVKLVGGVLGVWAEARVAGEVGAALRLEVLDRVLRARSRSLSLRTPRHGDHGSAHRDADDLGSDDVDAFRDGKVQELAALTTHVKAVENGVSRGVLAEVRAIVQLVPLAALLGILAPRLALSGACALAAFAVVVLFARRAIKRGHARATRESEVLLGAADEAVEHAELWTTYGAQGKVREHVARIGRAIVETTATMRARGALLSGTSEVLGALALVLALSLVTAGAVGGTDRGAIVPFAIAFFMAYRPLRELVEARLARGRGESANREAGGAPAPSLEVERETTDVSAPDRGRDWGQEELAIEGVVGRFGVHAPVTLTLRPGQIAAVVGPTGVGKTSLLRALLGLDPVREGRVRFGAEDITRRGVGPRERPFAWVPQDAPVLAETLVANVMLGTSEPREGEAERVLEELGAERLSRSIGGAKLTTERAVSGGERQWIAVARAMATRLPVLLLDEPTSSLDADAQSRMIAAIAALRGKRTVIVVTHRPEPLAITDVVVRLVGHGDLGGAQELAVEDVGAIALAEAQREASSERVDTPSAE